MNTTIPTEPRVLTAEEAQQLLAEGKTIQNAVIKGLQLQGDYQEPVRLQNVDLQRCKIQNANFKKGLFFQGSDLRRVQFVDKVVITGDLDLRGTTLNRVDILKTEITGGLRMDNSTVTAAMRVTNCKIHGEVKTWQARFVDWVEFRKTQFLGKADFRSFHADEGFVAVDCRFEGEFLFRGSTVTKKLEFSRSYFAARTDFSKAKFRDVAYLETIEQGPNQQFAFQNALFDRMLIRPEQIHGRLIAEQAGHHETAAEEYGLLKNNFQHLNRYDEEDWAFYRFKVNKRRALPLYRPLTKLCSFLFLDIGCGYGSRPFRAIATAAILIVLFAGVYVAGFQGFEDPSLPIPSLPEEHIANRSLFGLMTSVSVFTAGFTGEQLRNAQGWILAPLAIEALMGTLLWGLFIVAFSRKVIR